MLTSGVCPDNREKVMIRTIVTSGWSRGLCAVMAGILAGLFVPGPVPVARAAVGPGPKIYVFPYQPVFKGVSREIGVQTTDLLKNEIKQCLLDKITKKVQ